MTPPLAYYPPGVSIPNLVPNAWGTPAILATFAAACTVVLTLARTLATSVNPRISNAELAKALWSTLCGSIHLVLEGFYARHWATLQGSQHVLAQMWKEYSLSDSRYLTSDGFVMSMESITAWCWGPASFVLAWFVVTRNPYRHPLQIVIATGQVYGDVLYYATVAFDYLVYGVEYSRPEGYYFYVYFVMMNGFWIVIPGLLIADSVRACARAFAEVERVKGGGMNGQAKKLS